MLRHVYFAYGSNVFPDQMHDRCPGHEVAGLARLHGFALTFTGHSVTWGGPVATLVRVPGAAVDGVLYRLTDEHIDTLDGFEGHPSWYLRQTVELNFLGRSRLGGGDRPAQGLVSALTYIQAFDAPAPAAPRYIDVIQRGYEAHGLHLPPLLRAATGTFPHRGPLED